MVIANPGSCALLQVLATDSLWDVFTDGEVLSFISSYCAAAYAEMSAADALAWEAQRRWRDCHAQVGPGLTPVARI